MEIPIFSTAILFEWIIAEISVSRVGYSLKIPLVIWIVPARVEQQLGKMSLMKIVHAVTIKRQSMVSEVSLLIKSFAD